MSKLKDFSKQMNHYATQGIPFVFLIDFEMKKPVIFKLDEAAKHHFFFNINGKTNFQSVRCTETLYDLRTEHISLPIYRKAFDNVQKHIQRGDSYLLNLTCKTKVFSKNTLSQIFQLANAPYKLMYKDEFVLFSPESFIKIVNNKIYAYPMKGTIDAKIPNAKNILLADQKELFEHNTIVDLIRNDLSIIADNVQVKRFRYVEKITSNSGQILQVSSEIEGIMPDNWQNNLGDLLVKLLPAGSISGAPKNKTVQIIQATESEKRGYYTGIFGIFDGTNLDTAVNIRFVEKNDNQLFYRSGGGITALSKLKEEYNELKQKIYVPTY